MSITINIGLEYSAGKNSLAETLHAIGDAINYVTGLRTVISPTGEETLVVKFDFITISEQFIYELCADLKQECIAVRDDVTKQGRLIGPLAWKWGAFNPAYFVEV